MGAFSLQQPVRVNTHVGLALTLLSENGPSLRPLQGLWACLLEAHKASLRDIC